METCPNCRMITPGLYCPHCGVKKDTALAVRQNPPTPVRLAPAMPPPQVSNLAPKASKVKEAVSIDLIDDTPLHEIGSGSATRRAVDVMRSTDEEMLWEERPSPLLLATSALKYLGAIVIAVVLARVMHRGYWGVGILAFIGLVYLGFEYLKLRCICYRLSSQRLEVTEGLFNQRTVTWEVHQLGSSVIYSPLILRLFGRATLRINSPVISLSGIRKAKKVRDFLRNTGQLEAQRMDKMRWRNYFE